MKKILLVLGTRPEAIKMAPVIRELQKYPDIFNTSVCVTGQHRELLDQVLSLFGIIPDNDLDIMSKDQDLYDITSKILTGMREILNATKPDLVIVQGDTTTAMATSLAAFYKQVPVAHIEAGLRTHNIYSPWPEEINRSIIGRIATWHFAPTLSAKQNLLSENVKESQIEETGNTAIDALHWAIGKINSKIGKKSELNILLKDEGYDVNRLEDQRRLILITGHRRENFGEGFKNICCAIRDLSREHPQVDFVYPVHLNPNVRKPVHEILRDRVKNKNVFLINPLGYIPFVYLMNKSYMVLTDSGGIQEEAPALGKPVLVMRDTTERPEAMYAGTVQLVGNKQDKIKEAVTHLLINPDAYQSMSKAINPFGDGRAAEKIVSFISSIK